MQTGFFGTGVLSSTDLGELAKWGSEHGFTAMDVPHSNSAVRRVCDKYGLTAVSTYGFAANPITADDAKREQEMAKAEMAIQAAADQGVPCVMMGSEKDPEYSTKENLNFFEQAFTPLAKYADERGVKITFENWPNNGKQLAITPELWDRMFERVPSSALGLCFDPSHLEWMGIDYIRALWDFKDRIYHAHAKDTEYLSAGQYRYGIYGAQTEPGRWWRYRLPGFGVVDWPEYISTLYEIGYDGVLSIEHEDDVWGWRSDPERTQRGLLLAKRFLDPFMV